MVDESAGLVDLAVHVRAVGLEAGERATVRAEATDSNGQHHRCALGFVDATHFGRAFKIQYGVMPIEYRRLRTLSTPDGPATDRGRLAEAD